MSPVEKFDLAAWNRVLSLNLTAGFLLSKALLPAMLTKVGACHCVGTAVGNSCKGACDGR